MATNINFNSALGIVKNSIVLKKGLDPDAQAFITAAGITNGTQITAVNQLVLDLKSYNIWSKLRAVYPFVGGTATTHKFNLKDPQDTDSAFRIVFNGGWTHSNNGVQPNGTNAWGDTKFNPATNPSTNSTHISYYSRTDSASSCDLGGANAGYARGLYMMSKYITGSRYMNAYGSTSILSVSTTPTTGFFVLRRDNSATTIKSSQNGVSTAFAQNVILYGNYSIAVSAIALNNGTRTFFSNRELAFASMGLGLTDIENADFNTAVQTFQTTLGRNV